MTAAHRADGSSIGVLVTGASGAVGSVLVDAARGAGMAAQGLSRDPVTDGWTAALDAARAESAGGLVIVHAAIPPQPRSPQVMARYERESLLLVDRAQELGVDLTLVSTLSIRPGNPSDYVAHKQAMERLVLRRGGSVVRLGIVRGTGLAFTRIRDLVRRVPSSWITTPEARYYVTTPDDLSVWVRTQLPMAPGTIEACADRRPMSLADAVEVSAVGGRRWPSPVTLLARASGAGPIGRYLDPVINLRAGMGWVDTEEDR